MLGGNFPPYIRGDQRDVTGLREKPVARILPQIQLSHQDIWVKHRGACQHWFFHWSTVSDLRKTDPKSIHQISYILLMVQKSGWPVEGTVAYPSIYRVLAPSQGVSRISAINNSMVFPIYSSVMAKHRCLDTAMSTTLWCWKISGATCRGRFTKSSIGVISMSARHPLERRPQEYNLSGRLQSSRVVWIFVVSVKQGKFYVIPPNKISMSPWKTGRFHKERHVRLSSASFFEGL